MCQIPCCKEMFLGTNCQCALKTIQRFLMYTTSNTCDPQIKTTIIINVRYILHRKSINMYVNVSMLEFCNVTHEFLRSHLC